MNGNFLHKLGLFVKVLLLCLGTGVLVTATAFWFHTQGTGTVPAAAQTVTPARGRTNFVILGVDGDGTRTDVIIVGSFNGETGAIDLMSIPRDTYVRMPAERLDILKAEGKWVPADGEMKINAVYHYAGKTHGIPFLTAQLTELCGITIDYYAKVDLEAFRYLVDAIGGVEFDVPQRMYYTDPEQDLYIDLYPGLQTLSGAQAEQLVRYRKPDMYNPQSSGYAEGDLQRVKLQQAFMKVLIARVVTGSDLLNTSSALVATIFKYVDTDFGISDIPDYIEYVSDFSADNISCMTLPVEAAMIGGQSYVVMREPEASEVLASVFGGEAAEESSKGKDIIVLNGGHTKGKANELRERLTAEGFTVTDIGDYSGSLSDITRIYVRRRGQGGDLREFFSASEIIIEPPTDCDIRVVIGRGE